MRFKAFCLHLAGSIAIVGSSVLFVLLVWYPPPLAELQGLRSIILLLAAVDLILGPLATLIVANPRKPSAELGRDISVIVVVQFSALVYGLYTAYSARPAFVVYNADRFDVITASELTAERLNEAKRKEFQTIPLWGPHIVYARPPESSNERLAMTMSAALGGADIKDFPRLYLPWKERDLAVASKLRSLDELRSRNPERAEEIDDVARTASSPVDGLAYLPLIGRVDKGAVIVRRDTLEIVAVTSLRPNY